MTRMGFSPKLLAQGENVVMELRTHIKKMVGPFIVLVLTIVIASLLAWLVRSNDWADWIIYAIIGLALLALIVWVLIPFLKWRTSVYVITNRRLITREGIVTRTGRDIPLYRINDVTYEKGLLDRLLGCGTLIISDATEKAGVKLHDVPKVERVHVQMNELLFQADDGSDDGEFPPGEPPRGPIVPTNPF